MNDLMMQELDKLIQSKDIVLFMKGNAAFPQCGFSAVVVGILKKYNLQFTSINILEDQELRQGVKEYSDWPTFPQLYIKQEFIGGCDIVKELESSGELRELLVKHNLIAE
jgi:monothiol glutaredoxin